MGTDTDSDTCMDIQPDVPLVEADVALVPSQPVGRGRQLRPWQDMETSDSIMEFVRLLGGPGSRRPNHRHCAARRPESGVVHLDAPTSETVADGEQSCGRQSVAWFIPNEPRMRLPQDAMAKRNCRPREPSNAVGICKRHGQLVGKHRHIPRSHHIHVQRPRGRSCPPDPAGKGHGSGRAPQRPTRIWIPSQHLFRSQRLGTAPPDAGALPAGEDQISAALEENARALQSLRIQPDAAEGTSTSAVADSSST